jgi:hypothetical protein
MRITVLIFSLLTLFVLSGCDDGGGCPEPDDPGIDTSAQDIVSSDAQDDGGLPVDTNSDAASKDTAPDAGPPNTHPTLDPLPAVDLDMGTTSTLDLSDFMSDPEDPDSDLVLSWSAEHVAMQDGPGHELLVVAPVDWWGIETITITLTDTGGLEAAADLKVTVNELIPPVEPPPETCGEIIFNYTAPDADLVELAGGFNEWAPEPMSDGDDDGTWELTLILEPGAWEYKFVEDGIWKTDPTNPNKVADGYGGHNSLIEVPSCPED